MVHEVLLTVGLKVPDNEAYSALEALRKKMGLKDRVRDLAREDIWVLGVESESFGEAGSVVTGLVEGSNLFVNPNKHRYSIERALPPLGGEGLGENEIAVLVCDRESAEGESIVAACQRRLGVSNLTRAKRWVRWRVQLSEPPSPEDPGLMPLIRRIAVTTSRGDGLLSNPHSQISRAVLPWGEEESLVA